MRLVAHVARVSGGAKKGDTCRTLCGKTRTAWPADRALIGCRTCLTMVTDIANCPRPITSSSAGTGTTLTFNGPAS